MLTRRWVFLLLALAASAALATWFVAPRLLPGLRTSRSARAAERLPSFAGLPWVGGTAPLADAADGRPLALLLFSESDPRGLAALAALGEWQRSYAPLGARVCAIHVPAWSLAADSGATARLASRLAPGLPVALDADGRFAATFGGVEGGPRLLVTDERGRIASDESGALAPGEAALRAALVRVQPDAALLPAARWPLPAGVRSVVLAPGRVGAGPLADLSAGHEQMYTAEFRYQQQGHDWTPFPLGLWRLDPAGLVAERGGAAQLLGLRYSAGRAGVVMGPPPGTTVRVWVLRDDHWPEGAARDDDLLADGRGASYVDVGEPRLFWLVRGGGEHLLQLSPEQPGLTVWAFVFTDAR